MALGSTKTEKPGPLLEIAPYACYPYYTCSISGNIGDYLGQGPSAGGVQDLPTYWHSDCLLCDPTPGACHFPCVPDDGEEIAQAYNDVLNGMEHGDADLVLSGARRASGYVVWNSARRSIQLLSCDKSYVAASYEVDPTRVLETAEAIEEQ